jgi:hypothetical protein
MGASKSWVEWTPADDALLRKLWAEGLTSGTIAARIGRSRSAVLGRVGRQGLPKRGGRLRKRIDQAAAVPQQQASPLRPAPAKAMPRAPDAAPHRGRTSLNSPTPPGSPPLGGAGAFSKGVLFGEAKSTQCAFPLWGDSISADAAAARQPGRLGRAYYTCGQPTTRRVDGGPSPYCAGHHARCFVRRAAPVGAAGAAA